MCAELAALELKWIFMKIHYFGRRIRRNRQQRQQGSANWKQMGLDAKERIRLGADVADGDVRELLRIIEEIREKHPDKRKIAPADILAVSPFCCCC